MPGTRKLGRTTAHRNAMLRGMVTYLLENGSGGALCVIAQILIDKTALTPARLDSVLTAMTGLQRPFAANAFSFISLISGYVRGQPMEESFSIS